MKRIVHRIPRVLSRRTVLALLTSIVLPLAPAAAQQPVQQSSTMGAVTGKVLDRNGNPVVGAQVVVEGTGVMARTRTDGDFTLPNLPPGRHAVRVMMIGYRMQRDSITVTAGQRLVQNLALDSDPLRLGAIVVTGTVSARENMDASVALTTLSPQLISQSAPRSTTEMLRYVPGFTRVESSGGEVNQNISMRGVLGVEAVMFMEDGLPVFPTMHTYWMNADNLFRPDDNVDRIEVVRGGSSALFGSSTPGAIINIINRTGGPEVGGTMKATVGSDMLARYDFNVNGPLGEGWTFNLGGFYRYDGGVRDPGFPGVRGGQLKTSVTRNLQSGYVRASAKFIDDRNQFILPLPFTSPNHYVSGFSDYGALNTNEANHTRVLTPDGQLELPLDDGLRTRAYWLTADAGFDLQGGWNLRNSAQIMSNQQAFNAIFPGTPVAASAFAADQIQRLGLPANSPYEFVYTNHLDATGENLPFDNPNGLLSPSEQPHIEKPLTAFQDQLSLRKGFGAHTLSLGAYFAHYTQVNRWYIPLLLMDVRDQPRLVDLIVTNASGQQINVTKNGYRKYLNNYTSGSGQTTIFSGVIGGEFKLTDRLRADAGVRYERNTFVQTSANTSDVDLDGNPQTVYDIEPWANGTFRHLDRTMDDWAASLGLNYRLNERYSVYALGSRAYKMPALDEFLFGQEGQIELFEPRRINTGEAGLKYSSGAYAYTVTGFWVQLKNLIGQGLVDDPTTGGTRWIVTHNPESRSYGAELEGSANFRNGFGVVGNATVLNAELTTGSDIGAWVTGVPSVIGNLSTSYTRGPGSLTADWHYVAKRYSDQANTVSLPSYNYFNFGATWEIPSSGMTVTANVLNAFMSKGLEEGNPRAVLTGSSGPVFLARPLLPRRFVLGLRHDF